MVMMRNTQRERDDAEGEVTGLAEHQNNRWYRPMDGRFCGRYLAGVGDCFEMETTSEDDDVSVDESERECR